MSIRLLTAAFFRRCQSVGRLIGQATPLDLFTRRLFVDAGIGPGMRVLDVGSGMGDVALLAAELVGPTGSVVGVDTNPDALVAARRRAPENVNSVEGDIRHLELDGEFDAVVGRLVQHSHAGRTQSAALRHAKVSVYHLPSLTPDPSPSRGADG